MQLGQTRLEAVACRQKSEAAAEHEEDAAVLSFASEGRTCRLGIQRCVCYGIRCRCSDAQVYGFLSEVSCSDKEPSAVV